MKRYTRHGSRSDWSEILGGTPKLPYKAKGAALSAIKPPREIQIVLEIAHGRQLLRVVRKQRDVKFRCRPVAAVCIRQIGACPGQFPKDCIPVSKHANVPDA